MNATLHGVSLQMFSLCDLPLLKLKTSAGFETTLLFHFSPVKQQRLSPVSLHRELNVCSLLKRLCYFTLCYNPVNEALVTFSNRLPGDASKYV